MTMDRKHLARTAIHKALEARKSLGIALTEPVCAYTVADQLGLDVWFADIPSMEGIYSAGSRTVIVSALRPPGRQAFTCAHEIGHHLHGHGVQYDEWIEHRTGARRFDPNEFVADCFAGEMLMPKLVVSRGFALRGWNPVASEPVAFYVIASWVGVGYATLITHMRATLNMLSADRAEELLKYRTQIPELRKQLIGRECLDNLIAVDQHWYGRSIDAQVSELILLPKLTRLEGSCGTIIEENDRGTLVMASTPGIGRCLHPGSGWCAYMRVSRKNYVGRARYRFEEEVLDGN
jgi:Zn-dependent peptidase ImmA (M78 family)